jgi:hypothetical protein
MRTGEAARGPEKRPMFDREESACMPLQMGSWAEVRGRRRRRRVGQMQARAESARMVTSD